MVSTTEICYHRQNFSSGLKSVRNILIQILLSARSRPDMRLVGEQRAATVTTELAREIFAPRAHADEHLETQSLRDQQTAVIDGEPQVRMRQESHIERLAEFHVTVSSEKLACEDLQHRLLETDAPMRQRSESRMYRFLRRRDVQGRHDVSETGHDGDWS